MIKTFDEIEFDGEIVTLHGVGELGYSESFDLDSVDSVKSVFITINGANYYAKGDAIKFLHVGSVLQRIKYAKYRLTPANVTFDEMIKELAK